MKLLPVILSALLLAGCKSDAQRLDELQTEASLARLRVLSVERELAAVSRYNVDCSASDAHQRACERVDSLSRELRDLRIQRDLAERDLRRFLD